MNALTNKKPLVELREFNGLWSRGSAQSCPLDHFTDCYNCIFPGKGQVTIRESYTVQSLLRFRTVISFAVVEVSGGAALLTLDTNGVLVDETHGPTTIGGFFP